MSSTRSTSSTAIGADALRFTLAAMAAQGRDIKLSTARVEGYRNFATKLWNASRFAEMNGCLRVAGFDPAAVREPLNRWILGETATAAAETARAIEAYRFNDAANAVYRFVWNMFCDWHLELAKPVLQGADDDPAAKAETQATIAYVLDQIYRAAASVHAVPHRGALGDQGRGRPAARTGPLALGPWPAQGFEVDETVDAEIGWVVDLISEVRSVRSEMGVAPSIQTPLVLVAPSERTAKSARAWSDSIGRLARVGSIETAEAPPPGALLLVVRGETVALPLAGVVDLGGGEGATRPGDREGEARNRQGRGQIRQRRLRRPRARGDHRRASGAT